MLDKGGRPRGRGACGGSLAPAPAPAGTGSRSEQLAVQPVPIGAGAGAPRLRTRLMASPCAEAAAPPRGGALLVPHVGPRALLQAAPHPSTPKAWAARMPHPHPSPKSKGSTPMRPQRQAAPDIHMKIRCGLTLRGGALLVLQTRPRALLQAPPPPPPKTTAAPGCNENAGYESGARPHPATPPPPPRMQPPPPPKSKMCSKVKRRPHPARRRSSCPPRRTAAPRARRSWGGGRMQGGSGTVGMGLRSKGVGFRV